MSSSDQVFLWLPLPLSLWFQHLWSFSFSIKLYYGCDLHNFSVPCYKHTFCLKLGTFGCNYKHMVVALMKRINQNSRNFFIVATDICPLKEFISYVHNAFITRAPGACVIKLYYQPILLNFAIQCYKHQFFT